MAADVSGAGSNGGGGGGGDGVRLIAGAMSAGLAEVYFREGRFSPLDLDAVTHSQFRDR